MANLLVTQGKLMNYGPSQQGDLGYVISKLMNEEGSVMARRVDSGFEICGITVSDQSIEDSTEEAVALDTLSSEKLIEMRETVIATSKELTTEIKELTAAIKAAKKKEKDAN